MSSGKILFNGSQGTCWLIAPDRVITAAHCVGERGSEATVHFGTEKLAKVLDRDDALDAAVLEIDPLANPPPLPVCERPRNPIDSKWTAFGFPGALENLVQGITVGGEIRNFFARRNVADDALQLQCDEGGLPHFSYRDDSGDQAQVFSGMSGSAVRINGNTDHVVGLWLQSPTVLHAVAIYVAPMDLIVERFRVHLLGVVVAPWDDTPFLDIRRSNNGKCRVKAWPSVSEVSAAWNDDSKPMRITCEFFRGEEPELQSALLRLIVHSKAIEALEFSNHDDWRDAGIQAAKSGLPIDNFIATSVISPMPWSTVVSRVPVSAELLDLTPTELAKAIHDSCDRWTLFKLVTEMDRVLDEDSTADLIRFDISADLRDPMRQLWRNWLQPLQNNPAFLNHFLTLMLTAEGDFDVGKKALIAAGPRTLSVCLVRLVAFALAVNCCIEESFHPSPQLPGNLGNAEHTGHACGIEIHQKKRLHLTINAHVWRTPVVLLPHLEQEASVVYATTLLLNESTNKPNISLSANVPRTLLLTGEAELLRAMGESKGALTTFLRQKGDEFYTQQKKHFPQEG